MLNRGSEYTSKLHEQDSLDRAPLKTVAGGAVGYHGIPDALPTGPLWDLGVEVSWCLLHDPATS